MYRLRTILLAVCAAPALGHAFEGGDSAPAADATTVAVAPAASAPPPLQVTVAWRNKPPYHYLENGQERGFLLERSKRIFALAGLEAKHVEMPSKRIWKNLANSRNFCSIGWYRLPAREKLVNFSRPFHVDKPHTVVVAPQALAIVKSHATLTDLMQDRRLTLGVVDGVSYGLVLDAMIEHSANKIEKLTVDPETLMHMAAINRISYVLIDRADWRFTQRHAKDADQLRNVDFADMPPELTRYIVCSKNSAPQLLEKVNAAIAEMHLKLNVPAAPEQ